MTRQLRILFIGLILITSLPLISCNEKAYKIVIDKKNPVEYTFKTPKDSLFNAITKEIIFVRLPVMTLKNRRIIPKDILELLLVDNNNQDIFLWSIADHWKSKIYQNKNGQFLDYIVSFYLHLESIDETHTKVIIATIEPKIILRKELLPSPPHFVRNYKTIPVEPSTIEEYEVLLEIGKMIGEKDMPPLILPNENRKIEIVK